MGANDDPRSGLDRLESAQAALDGGSFDQAEAEFAGLTADEAFRAQAHEGLGRVAFARDQLDKASAEFREATRWDPGLSAAYTYLGRIADAQGKKDEASRYFKLALQPPAQESRQTPLPTARATPVQQRKPADPLSEKVRPQHGTTPSYASQVRVVRGREYEAGPYVGIARAVERRQHHERQILSFRLERYSGAEALSPIPIELSGLSLEGALREGDEVEVSGEWTEGRALRPDRLINRTTGGVIGETAEGKRAEAVGRRIVRINLAGFWVALCVIVVVVVLGLYYFLQVFRFPASQELPREAKPPAFEKKL